jgi:hypothetical protein
MCSKAEALVDGVERKQESEGSFVAKSEERKQLSALSEKLEYFFFSPRIFQCYFMNIT